MNAPGTLAAELLAQLPASPDAYPQKVDAVRQAVLVVRLDAAAYRAASFLDDRVLGPAVRGAWLAIDAVADAARRVVAPRPLHYVFHTGHVGSTLLSRLLDETGLVLPLREPLSLRNLADAHDVLPQPESLWSPAQFEQALALFSALWRRGYQDTHSVVVKATSSAGRLALPLLACSRDSRAVYLNLRAEPYLAALLAGANSPLDLRGHGPGRMRRLQARLAAPPPPLHALSPGELAAMSWLTESWTRHETLAQAGDRVLALDFDELLADVGATLQRVLAHFALPADAATAARLARSPALSRYSKAPEHGFSPAERAALLAETRREHADEIRRGRAWLDRCARADAGAAAVIAAGS